MLVMMVINVNPLAYLGSINSRGDKTITIANKRAMMMNGSKEEDM